jgi:hypothetical protein
MYIKAFGERNSGTNALSLLLSKNFKKNVKNVNNLKKNVSYLNNVDHEQVNDNQWKHALPKDTIWNSYGKDILFIFIVRNLDEWLDSMYKHPYHISKNKSFFEFVTNNIEIKNNNKNWEINNETHESDRNLIQLRYLKYKKYTEFFKKFNSVIINLNSLKKNPEKVIKLISNTFDLELKNPEKIEIVDYNVKNKKEYEKISEEKKLDNDIKDYDLSDYIDNDIENEINNLEISINKLND